MLQIHTLLGGPQRGRRYELEVLNKSAIVLVTAFWEAYCEDIARQALFHIADHLESADDLPKNMKKRVAGELKGCKHELAIWQISDNKWRAYLKTSVDLIERMNTPETRQVNGLFDDLVGLSNISESWRWPGMSARNAENKLDKYISLRHAIAHRGESANYVQRSQVIDYASLVKRLAAKTGGRVNGHVRKLTGKRLWT